MFSLLNIMFTLPPEYTFRYHQVHRSKRPQAVLLLDENDDVTKVKKEKLVVECFLILPSNAFLRHYKYRYIYIDKCRTHFLPLTRHNYCVM